MKHYDYVDWVLYKKDLLDTGIKEEMEDHLYGCDQCMEIFLSLIDQEEIKVAQSYGPKNFNKKVLRKIKTSSFKDFFIYYAAVASVAIILTASGSFGKIVGMVPQIDKTIKESTVKYQANIVYSFSETITNKTSDFINDFSIKNKGGL